MRYGTCQGRTAQLQHDWTREGLLRDGSKFIVNPGRDHRRGVKTFFERQLGGVDFFFEKIGGGDFFSKKKIGGEDFFSKIKNKGGADFFTTKFENPRFNFSKKNFLKIKK